MAAETTGQPGHHKISAREVLQEERYLWMSRAFVVMVVLAIICNIILLIALANVTPVMRVQPFYLEIQDKEHQVINIVRPSAETLDSDLLKESLLRQYLLARFGMGSDLTELEERWGEDGIVYWMSVDSVFSQFTQEARQLLQLAHEDNLVRTVRILSAKKASQGNAAEGAADVWEIKLEFQDMNRSSEEPKLKYFVAKVEIVFRPTRSGLLWSQRLKNPLGFTVTRFGLSPLKQQ